jgi:membrane protein
MTKEGIKQAIIRGWDFARYLVDGFLEDNCRSTAQALTFQTLFAVVPLLTMMYAIINAFKGFGDLTEKVEAFVFDNIIPENVSVVQEYLVSFSDQARNLGFVSILFVAFVSFLMLYTVEGTFNSIWRVKEPRRGFQRFLMYWAVLTLAVPFTGLSLAISGYVESLPFISDFTRSTPSLKLVPLLISSVLFTLVYAVIPNCVVPLRHAAIGGFTVAVIGQFKAVIFVSMMSQSDYEAIYGTFAAVPLFLLWIWLSWIIVLIGAELVKSLGVYRFSGSQNIEAPLSQLIVVLELFYTAHQKGEVVTERDIRKYRHRIDLEQWTEIQSRLIGLKLIRAVERGGFVLSRDLSEISVWDLYLQLPWQLPQNMKGDKPWEKKLSQRFTVLKEDNKSVLQDDLETLFKET